jgi:hypothetical protein
VDARNPEAYEVDLEIYIVVFVSCACRQKRYAHHSLRVKARAHLDLSASSLLYNDLEVLLSL